LVATLGDFGVESARAAGIVGVLASNTDELTRLQDLANTALLENTSITDEFNIKNDTLNANIEKLKNRWEALILEWEQGKGVGESLKNVIKFLADNLQLIIKVIYAGLRAWVLQKLAMQLWRTEVIDATTSINRGLIPSIIAMFKQLKLSAIAFRTTGFSVRGFITALKSIPFIGIISGISSVVGLLWDNTEATDVNTEAIARNTDANKGLNDELRLRAVYIRELNKLIGEGQQEIVNQTTEDLSDLAEIYRKNLSESQYLVDNFKVQDKALVGSNESFEAYLETLLRSTSIHNEGI
jgi:hypothetical protein